MTSTYLIQSRKSHYLALVRFLNITVSILVIAMALMAGGWRFAQMFGGASLHAAGESVSKSVVVSRGDTLWELAVEYGSVGVDTRKVVAQIRTLNQLSGADLQPGMVLRVPVE